MMPQMLWPSLYVMLLRQRDLRTPDSVKGAGLSAAFHKCGDVCAQRDGVEFAKRIRRDVPVHRGGGTTKESESSRRHPPGGWGLWMISVSLVVGDVRTSPPSRSRSLTSPHKTHQQKLPY